MPRGSITLADLRRFAVARSLFTPTTLRRAIIRMDFVQADPIRAPARAQDLVLRHRVKSYHAGDLERHYVSLGIEEDTFVNYGFVTKRLESLMHPRPDVRVPAEGVERWSTAERKKAELLLDFLSSRGEAHPRDVEEHFAHGRVRNYWGGSSNATTHMLDALQYSGLVRVARRVKGIRIYRAHRHEPIEMDESERRLRMDALVDVVVNLYAPLLGSSLSYYVRRLRYAAPQWQAEIPTALLRARERLAKAKINGSEWYWPGDENPHRSIAPESVRLLAPFDPVVHDRARFELFWEWTYRFEAYVPAPKRKLGYYALPLLWRDRVIGWANLSVKNGVLLTEFGYVAGEAPRDRAFKNQLDAELVRMRDFLRVKPLAR